MTIEPLTAPKPPFCGLICRTASPVQTAMETAFASQGYRLSLRLQRQRAKLAPGDAVIEYLAGGWTGFTWLKHEPVDGGFDDVEAGA
jgi:hypothetical protein